MVGVRCRLLFRWLIRQLVKVEWDLLARLPVHTAQLDGFAFVVPVDLVQSKLGSEPHALVDLLKHRRDRVFLH